MKRIQTTDQENPARIVGIQFSILSPEEIVRNSVVEITSKDSGKKNNLNNLTIGGLFDSKMGVTKSGTYCPTDGLTYLNCPGYFGHIVLARPVFFIQYLKEIVRVLKCICHKCGKLLMDKRRKYINDLSPELRFKYLSSKKASTTCGAKTEDGCGFVNPDFIKKDGVATLTACWKNFKNFDRELTAEFVYELFSRISDEDVNFLGLSSTWSRPEWMICKVLPIAPPIVRPSAEIDSNKRADDDLTRIYMHIIKNNNLLHESIQKNASAEIIRKYHIMAQYFVAIMVNNKIASPLTQPSGRPLQCIIDRLNGKKARVRGNLMGKRVDFSARTVINGDPNLSITELGVPKRIAMNITKPVVVNARNRTFLTSLVQNGPDIHPGAKTIECVNGMKITLRDIDRMSIQLTIGDVVHRHMMDGDMVLFNRQPSLHRMSMMGHIVRVMEYGNTFRFNVAVTKPYNADFDGDEMNMHMPQSVSAETELKCLPAVPYHLISPSNNAIIISTYQDSMLGIYLFTKKGVRFTKKQAMRLLFKCQNIDGNVFQTNSKFITNYEILSLILPPMTHIIKTKLPNSDPIVIRNGKWISGQVDKSAMSGSTKGLLHRICNDFGNHRCVAFLNDLQNIVTEFMNTRSYSVGIGDIVLSENVHEKINELCEKGIDESEKLISKIRLGMHNHTGALSVEEEFEVKMTDILSETRKDMEMMGSKNLQSDNKFTEIVTSGSKGSTINISQMTTCLGQQSIEGKRAPYGFDNRTLPHFMKYDDSAKARGFISSSYSTGLTPEEMLFHAMAGRNGLIDTAIKTSQTGYAQRRIVKSMEDVIMTYDGTARNHMGKIVQFIYGDDGFNSTMVETQFFPLIEQSVEEIYFHFDMNTSSEILTKIFTSSAKKRLNTQKQECLTMCQKFVEKMLKWRDQIVENVFHFTNENQIRLPISFVHIINNVKGSLELQSRSVDITPLETFQLLENYYSKILSISKYFTNNELFRAMFDYFLSPKVLLYDHQFNRAALTLLLETIVVRVKQSIVHPGEMVGIIAAQSIGEPTTQLTLNTFHSAGVATKANVTRGVPRIDEILRLTSNPKNPSLTITPFACDEENQDRVIVLSNLIECTLLKDVVKRIQIIYDPNDSNTRIEEDRFLLNQYRAFQEHFNRTKDCKNSSFSKCIIRMEMNRSILLDKNITMDDIQFAISSTFGTFEDDTTKISKSAVHCIYSDFNDDNLIFRVRVQDINKTTNYNSLDATDEISMLKMAQEKLLTKIVLRGVDKITKVIPRKIMNNVVLHDGKYTRRDTWVLDTIGTNMIDVMGLSYIDYRRVLNNDIQEVLSVLGIEAARQVILNELIDVMEFSDVYINYHHTSLLADRMCYSKNMVAVYRSGILNDEIGPIAKSTFEMHTDMFLRASVYGELDNMRGVSANTMCGQPGLYGTNAFKVYVDIDDLEQKHVGAKKMFDANPTYKLSKQDNQMTSVNVFDISKTLDEMMSVETMQDECSKSNFVIENYLSNKNIGQKRGTECLQDTDDYNVGF